MIEHVQGAGAGAPQPSRPGSQGPSSKRPAAPVPAPSSALAPEYSRRLNSIAARLEELQQSLSSLQSGAGDTASEEARLLQEISAAQVAFQNILATGTPGEAAVIESLSGDTATGHALKPSVVLQLLE
jgi:hypothetical protein